MGNPDIREFLCTGTIIRTKLIDGMNWVTNIVSSINEDYLEIDMGIEKEYIDSNIVKDDTVKCKYTVNNIEYMFSGMVTKINTEFPQSITIRVQQVDKFDNIRDSYRFDVYLSSVIKAGGKDDKGIFAVLVNLSRTGAAFVLKEDIEKLLNIKESKGDKTPLWVDVYTSPVTNFSFVCKIMRKKRVDKGIEYGIKITDINPDEEKKLNELLTELVNKDKEFYNRQSGFWSNK